MGRRFLSFLLSPTITYHYAFSLKNPYFCCFSQNPVIIAIPAEFVQEACWKPDSIFFCYFQQGFCIGFCKGTFRLPFYPFFQYLHSFFSYADFYLKFFSFFIVAAHAIILSESDLAEKLLDY